MIIAISYTDIKSGWLKGFYNRKRSFWHIRRLCDIPSVTVLSADESLSAVTAPFFSRGGGLALVFCNMMTSPCAKRYALMNYKENNLTFNIWIVMLMLSFTIQGIDPLQTIKVSNSLDADEARMSDRVGSICL